MGSEVVTANTEEIIKESSGFDEPGLHESGSHAPMGLWARTSQWCEALTTNGDFEAFIMLIIAGTIVTLALNDPLQGDMEGINGTLYWLSKSLRQTVLNLTHVGRTKVIHK